MSYKAATNPALPTGAALVIRRSNDPSLKIQPRGPSAHPTCPAGRWPFKSMAQECAIAPSFFPFNPPLTTTTTKQKKNRSTINKCFLVALQTSPPHNNNTKQRRNEAPSKTVYANGRHGACAGRCPLGANPRDCTMRK